MSKMMSPHTRMKMQYGVDYMLCNAHLSNLQMSLRALRSLVVMLCEQDGEGDGEIMPQGFSMNRHYSDYRRAAPALLPARPPFLLI